MLNMSKKSDNYGKVLIGCSSEDLNGGLKDRIAIGCKRPADARTEVDPI
jgi:hypothetical protein